jgi:hypothetical protein
VKGYTLKLRKPRAMLGYVRTDQINIDNEISARIQLKASFIALKTGTPLNIFMVFLQACLMVSSYHPRSARMEKWFIFCH